MAQENSPDKEKRQGRTKKPEKPYVEQIDELLLVHNKNDPKEGLRVISKMDEKGNYQTVTPEEHHFRPSVSGSVWAFRSGSFLVPYLFF